MKIHKIQTWGIRVTLGAAIPLAGVFAALASYGPARLYVALGGAHADTLPIPESLAPGGRVFPAGTVIHPYAADLVGTMSALVLVGLTVVWVLNSLRIAKRFGRNSRQESGSCVKACQRRYQGVHRLQYRYMSA